MTGETKKERITKIIVLIIKKIKHIFLLFFNVIILDNGSRIPFNTRIELKKINNKGINF